MSDQIEHFKMMLEAAYDLPVTDKFGAKDGVYLYQEEPKTHRSRSQELPIIRAFPYGNHQQNANVSIDNLSNNFYFYFLSLKLKDPIPANFLQPISGLFGKVALSGHVTDRNFISNFQKAYHNVERLDKFSFSFGHPLSGVTAIRYLNEISKLDLSKILDVLLYKTRYGMIDNIDHGAIETEKCQELAEMLGLESSGYCQYKVSNPDGDFFKKIEVDVYDSTNGSNVEVQTGYFLPPLPCPGEILVEPSQDLRDAGIGGGFGDKLWIPCALLKPRTEQAQLQIRHPHQLKLNNAYRHVSLETRKFKIKVPHGIDGMFTAFMLHKCLVPAMRNLEKWMCA